MGKFFMRLVTGLHGKLVRYTGKLGGGTDDGSILVLRHTGAKSGSERETPLMFVNYNGGYVVCASMAGAPNNPAWYHNLQAHPDVVVTVAKEPIDVHARELTDAERDEVWARFTASGERWEQYETRTERVLPLIALEHR